MARIATKFIQNSAVTNAKLANVANNTLKGNVSGGSAAPSDLTGTQATTILVNFVGDSGSGGVKGLVPAPASGDAAALKYLEANGTWMYASLQGAEVSSTTTITTTSLTDVVATGMTITPGISGTYLVLFNSTVRSGNNGADVSVSIYNNGTQISHSVRTVTSFKDNQENQATITQALVSVTAGQTVDIRWKTTTNTATMTNRSMQLIRIF